MGNEAHVHHLLIYLCSSVNETRLGIGETVMEAWLMTLGSVQGDLLLQHGLWEERSV